MASWQTGTAHPGNMQRPASVPVGHTGAGVPASGTLPAPDGYPLPGFRATGSSSQLHNMASEAVQGSGHFEASPWPAASASGQLGTAPGATSLASGQPGTTLRPVASASGQLGTAPGATAMASGQLGAASGLSADPSRTAPVLPPQMQYSSGLGTGAYDRPQLGGSLFSSGLNAGDARINAGDYHPFGGQTELFSYQHQPAAPQHLRAQSTHSSAAYPGTYQSIAKSCVYSMTNCLGCHVITLHICCFLVLAVTPITC